MWYFIILGIVVLFPLRFKDRARWRAHSETSPGERRCVVVPARTGHLHVPPGHPQPLAVEARPAGHVRLPPRLRPVARLSGCTSSRGPGGGGGGRDLSLDLPAAQCSLPRKHRSAPPAVRGVYGSSLAAGGPCPAFGHRRAFPLCPGHSPAEALAPVVFNLDGAPSLGKSRPATRREILCTGARHSRW